MLESSNILQSFSGNANSVNFVASLLQAAQYRYVSGLGRMIIGMCALFLTKHNN